MTDSQFHLYRSGALVALETFGAMVAIPSLAQWALGAGVRLPSSVSNRNAKLPSPHGQHEKQSTAVSCKVRVTSGFSHSSAHLSALGAASLMAALRTCSALSTMLSAAIQRRHLYAWSLFAPRFAFDACFLIFADISFLIYMHVWRAGAIE